MNKDKQHLLFIGRFAKASYLSLKALRLYDQKGILKPAHIAPESDYRYYRIEQLDIARLIPYMRQMEMPLVMIQQILLADPDEVGEILRDYLQSCERRVEVVRRTIRSLISHLRNEEVTPMSFEVDVKEVTPQQIVSISKHVYIGQLDSHIRGSINFLKEFVKRQDGEIVGPSLGIYHAPVNQEDSVKKSSKVNAPRSEIFISICNTSYKIGVIHSGAWMAYRAS